MRQKQIEKTHYHFSEYITKKRFASMWHQLDEVFKLKPDTILEVGPGPGIFKAIAGLFGINVETFDIDPDLKPDHVGSIEKMPFEDGKYDIVCAFQVLEHLPYDIALSSFSEMARVSKKHLLISLPDAKELSRYCVHIPKIAEMEILVPKPRFGRAKHVFDGEHYWEINKEGYELKKITRDFSSICMMIKTYRVKENPYHRFFIFSKETHQVF